ncbi:MAG: DUF2188 domain-containing protein [bacterium]
MKRTIYHITPRRTENGLEWAVKRERAERAVVIVPNKSEAIKIAKDILESHELGQIKIHDKDNIIQREYTYGKDPEKYIG